MKTKKHRSTTYNEKLRRLVDKYVETHGVSEIDMNEAARWLIQTGQWRPRHVDMISRCRGELSRACREEYYTDPQGREVRKKHPYRVKRGEVQKTFWVDITTADPKKMKISLQQRRRGILADCRQHKTDTDSYNDNNTFGAQLDFEYNFDPDLLEESMPTEYPDERPE